MKKLLELSSSTISLVQGERTGCSSHLTPSLPPTYSFLPALDYLPGFHRIPNISGKWTFQKAKSPHSQQSSSTHMSCRGAKPVFNRTFSHILCLCVPTSRGFSSSMGCTCSQESMSLHTQSGLGSLAQCRAATAHPFQDKNLFPLPVT